MWVPSRFQQGALTDSGFLNYANPSAAICCIFPYFSSSHESRHPKYILFDVDTCIEKLLFSVIEINIITEAARNQKSQQGHVSYPNRFPLVR